MIKKTLTVFGRDVLTAARDSMALFIIVMPVLLAIAITLFTPGLNDTTVNIALLENDDPAHITFMEQFAKVELFPSAAAVEERITRRDDIAGLLPLGDGNDGYEIVLQGNESQVVEEYTALLSTFYELGTSKADTTATLLSFGHTVPPLKTMLVNSLISITIMLSGMLIAISIVGEKADNTINALNVTPLSQTAFVIGKSMMGGLIALASIIVTLLITGYYDIDWIMILLVGVMSLILSFIVGFLQGLASDDIIEAAANVKMIMLPAAGSILGFELLADKWQWTMYWSPFYWAYKANKLVLSKTADWGTILLCSGMVLALSLAVYLVAAPKIRKGLS